MSDIAFSFSADEKDVQRALQNLVKENAKLRAEITSGVNEAKAAAAQEREWAKLREKTAKEANQQMAQLNAAAQRIRDSVATPFEEAKKKVAELRDHLQAGRLTTEEYRRAYANVAKELKEATRDHAAEAEAARAAAAAKSEASRKAADAEREHAAAMREADSITQKLMTKEERYAANVAKLNALKDKGVLSITAYSRALIAERKALEDTGGAADKSGGLIGGLTSKMSAFVAGLASGSAVLATIRQEYDLLIERQGKSKDANLGLAGQQEALLMNLGGADPAAVFKSISKLSKDSNVKEENITAAVNDAMAARADLGVDQVVNAVGSVSKIRKLAPSEMAGLAAATIDTQKQTGLGTDQSLGFLLQMQGQARTKNLKSLAENMTPAVGGVMNFGADRQTAGAMLAALSHGMGDTTGAMTATSAIQLSKQLREFSGGQDIGKSIEALQQDPELRKKFLANASFEAKALPAIESLLGGGVQAKQFASAKDALSKDPMIALQEAIKAREASGAIGIAEEALVNENAVNQGQLKDQAGARSAINRDAIKEMRQRAGRLGISAKLMGIGDDLRTGGVQTAETQAEAIRMEIARLQAGETDATLATRGLASAIPGAQILNLGADQMAKGNVGSKQSEEQIAVLKELLAVIQAQADEQKAKTHAGVQAGRARQMEGAP